MHKFMPAFTKITGILPMAVYLKPRLFWKCDKSELKSGAEIVVSNHTTLLDFATLMFIYGFRNVRVLVAEVIYQKNRACAWFMRKMGSIRVDRAGDDNSRSLSEAEATLLDGGCVGVFPEGRLNRDGVNFGSILRFSGGAAYLSLRTGAPVRLVYMQTAGGLFRSTSAIIDSRVSLRDMFGSDTGGENVARATKYIEERMFLIRCELMNLKNAREHASLFGRYLRSSIHRALTVCLRPKYFYTDKETQSRKLTRPMVIVANHFSVYDPPMLCETFYKSKSAVHIIACEVLYERKALAWLLDRLGCIRLDRNVLDMDSFRAMVEVLSRGESVGVFPEGRMSETRELLELKSGFVLAAMKARVDVLPVYIADAYRLFRARQRVFIDVPIKMDVAPTLENVRERTRVVQERFEILKQKAELQYKEASSCGITSWRFLRRKSGSGRAD